MTHQQRKNTAKQLQQANSLIINAADDLGKFDITKRQYQDPQGAKIESQLWQVCKTLKNLQQQLQQGAV